MHHAQISCGFSANKKIKRYIGHLLMQVEAAEAVLVDIRNCLRGEDDIDVDYDNNETRTDMDNKLQVNRVCTG